MNKILTIVVGLATGSSVLIAGGCSSTYYHVKDPVNGQIYYTEEIDEMSGGAIKFKDQRTGSVVTIQNSVVKEINEREYTTGKFAVK